VLLRRCATCPAGSLSPQGAGARLADRWGNCARASAADVAAAATARFHPAGVVRMTPLDTQVLCAHKKNEGEKKEKLMAEAMTTILKPEWLAKVLAVGSAPGVDGLHTRKYLYAVYARQISVYEA
jgi:hypothetical protein